MMLLMYYYYINRISVGNNWSNLKEKVKKHNILIAKILLMKRSKN